jgi:hypothetical protein
MRQLQQLDLSLDCKLTSLVNNTFVHLANSSLTTLLLTGCSFSLHDVQPCVFCPLKNLSVVDMSYSHVVMVSLQKVLDSFYAFEVSGQVVDIFNSRKFGTTMPVGFHLTEQSMAHVLNTCVRWLVLSDNYIVSIGTHALGRPNSLFSKCIEILDLSYNAIFHIDIINVLTLHFSVHLRQIDYQQQRIFNLERAAYMLKTRAELSRDSHIHHFDLPTTIIWPQSFEVLNISAAAYLVGYLPPKITVANAPNVRILDLSYIRFVNCTCVVEGLENLELLNITGNDCYNTSLTFFDAFPRLKILSMQKMTFAPEFVANNGRRLFHNLTLLEILDLSYNDLDHLPPDLLSRQPALRELLLTGNNLESLDLDVSHHDSLTLLDLSDNRFSMLSEKTRQSLDTLVARRQQPLLLRLHGNPLACTCATLDFVRWLGETRVFLDQGGDYTCVTDSGQLSSTGVEARKWMATWRRCVGPTALWSAMALLLLMTSLTGAVWGVAKNATRLRFLFTVLRHIRMPQRTDFACDAYVAYCDADTELVCGRLRRELGVRRGVRLLIKDLPVDAAGTQFWQYPGDNVPFKILEHIDLSWKVILVLTPALARDDIAGFMSRAALQSVTDRMPRRVLLLYVGQRRLPELASVQALLETVPESQVFFLPELATPCEHRALWDAVAQAILE